MAFPQILLLRNPDAKLNHPSVARRRPDIEAKPGSHLCIPVARLTISQMIDSIVRPIANGRRVERRFFARRSIDYLASSGKLWVNQAIIVPGWISPPPPLLVPAKQRGGNQWPNQLLTDVAAP